MQRIIADLQIHSKYSRAVSQQMNLKNISLWADKKGIKLVATGDWTHPLWFREITKELKEAEPGIFKLKDPLPQQKGEVFFLLSTEISSIYKQGDKVRRIHNLIFMPSISSAEKFVKKLQQKGCNLMADGRPVIGLSSIEIAELAFETDPHALVIPAHIWTPWFSLFGSNSGFDSIQEAFGPYADKIYAIETGLSSDPIMNWQIEELDNRTILSFSDAHSLPKLGREATVFGLEGKKSFTYFDLEKAIKGEEGSLKILYTIEFFPEEGKYHYSGHRKCGIKLSPDEVEKIKGICPVCNTPLTIGVSDRVRQLSKRKITEKDLIFKKNSKGVVFVIDKEKKRKPFVSLVPLVEILEQVEGSPIKAKRKYEEIVEKIGREFEILLDKDIDEIAVIAGKKVAQAIKNVRERKVKVDPGYDGVFGFVKVTIEEENEEGYENEIQKSQLQLF